MVKELTDGNFEKQILKAGQLALIDFWAPWCGPCQIMNPIIEALAQEMGPEVIFGKLNVDQSPQTSQKYGIMSIPTLIIFNRGKAVEQIIGLRSKEELREKLKKFTS